VNETELLRCWLAMGMTLVAAFTTGEYYFRRRKMKRFDFSMWRERRLTYIGILLTVWFFAPTLLHQGNTFLASLLDR
jgi:hypothetical protein